jgi:DNA-binding HxlR family transcriptional regulator
MKTDAERLCPQVEAIFSLLARKWAGLIVFELGGGEKRFADLKTLIPGLSSRVLTLRLRELEAAGLVERMVKAASPVRVSYRLSDKGRSLGCVMAGLAEWAGKYGSGQAGSVDPVLLIDAEG